MWGFPLWQHVRTKVTFTTESGTSTDALQCGFYAVHDLLCTAFHSKNHTAVEVQNKKRWKTKDVLEGRTKLSKDDSAPLFFCVDESRASRAAMMKICTGGMKKDKITQEVVVFIKNVYQIKLLLCIFPFSLSPSRLMATGRIAIGTW